MKISNKIIDSTITEVAGEDVVKLVHALKNKKNVSEFKLAENIKQEVNLTRNMLYRLYDSNLVSFIRKKDKKKGWYIYYWTFNGKRITHLLKKLNEKKLDRLQQRLDREQAGQFYACKNNCCRLEFDKATDFEFKCPECGSLIDQEDNTQTIVKIKKEVEEMKKQMK